ncbi:amino acid adenylation domain-containing protein [Amycolatopsis arida]|uniref:Amino acid adenylation domain-containing protein n=1 Tax=Amycolatopsis arida TaxID=587909 RepID=A0A1I5QB96_9PSEU|nr:amino acid adenylation domain-containing protein [Amycolatopsis arida]SFP43525.1 amino acid adenylation domain-containing protein [Amycolatopsis arida]
MTNDSVVPYVRDVVRRWPGHDAVSWAGTTVSYGELHALASAIAAVLLEFHGEAVAVRVPSGHRQIATLLGVLAAGAQLLWLGAHETGERGRVVLRDLRPACLVLDGAEDEFAEFYRAELSGKILDLGTVVPTAAPLVPVEPGGPAYFAYTSGSTGTPKGVAQTHAALAQFTSWLGGTFEMGPGARVAQWVAPEHDPALCEVFATLVSGGTLCPVPERIRANPDKLVGWLAEERITHLQTIPSFMRELLRAGLPSTLRCLLLMGEALPAELVNGLRSALPAARLVNLYGPTEVIAATWHEIAGEVQDTTPIGVPIPGRAVLVLDDQDQPCPVGVTGNLVVRSPYVTPGYFGVGRTDAFRPDGCYRTGDLACLRPDGLLEFRGRRDFQVKVAGVRLELGEVEAALAGHESVRECAVVPTVDADGLTTHLVAYVVPHKEPEVRAWRSYLRARFGRSMSPIRVKVLSGRLPRTVAGKVDRRRLAG